MMSLEVHYAIIDNYFKIMSSSEASDGLCAIS